LATQRTPLPHISDSDPSALNMRMRTSAILLGSIRIKPSLPMPLWRSEIARETRAYEEAGADHIVYDLRFRYADWLEQIDLLGREVLPALRG